ncbi:MAG: hypothetical protein U5J63_16790 [Fodinibius sp.]|nr:hypothetical protein [Fodinibius sp.]
MAQGFPNGGIYRADLNFPSFLRNCWEPAADFDQPMFSASQSALNLEVLTPRTERSFWQQHEMNGATPPSASLYSTLKRVKRYWEGHVESNPWNTRAACRTTTSRVGALR